MIIFHKIRYKNFLSFGNIFTEIDLSKHKTNLCTGFNGAGKSSLLDALTFVLFGKPFRKINKPQLLNSITKKDMVVETEFSIGTNNYKIIRGIKPSIFEVYQNDKMLNQSAESKDYQEILENQIIKVNYKTFCQVVVLGSATFQPFMQLSASQRREVIEDLLDLQIFTAMNNILKIKIMQNGQVTNECNLNKRATQDKIKIIQDHILEKQKNNEETIRIKNERILELKTEIINYQNTLESHNKKIQKLSLLSQNEEKIQNKLSKLHSLKHKIEANLSILNKDVKFFQNNDNCPICKQVIEKIFKENTINLKIEEIAEIEYGLGELTLQYNELNDKIKELVKINNEIRNIELEKKELKIKINSNESNINYLTVEIHLLNCSNETVDENKLSTLEIELQNLIKKYNEITQEKEVLSAASILLKDGGIKAKIIKQYVPVINKLINKNLAALDFFVQLELDEEFNETIMSRYRDDFSYSSFSEGEKMKINLAILFTWRAVAKLRNSINTNILIMDEVFDSSLDLNGTDEFLKLLNDLPTNTNTFIISHKTDQLVDKFANILRFQKSNNFSKVT